MLKLGTKYRVPFLRIFSFYMKISENVYLLKNSLFYISAFRVKRPFLNQSSYE